jgi:hypothetical protein
LFCIIVEIDEVSEQRKDVKGIITKEWKSFYVIDRKEIKLKVTLWDSQVFK